MAICLYSQQLQLWAAVLQLDPNVIGVQDDFLYLGGDSISAMKLVVSARAQGISLTVADIFKNLRLCDMALTASTATESFMAQIAPFAILGQFKEVIQAEIMAACQIDEPMVEDIYPCTPLQEGFMALAEKQKGAYIAQDLITIPKDVDLKRYQTAWETLIAREPILRTRIVPSGLHGMMQVVLNENVSWKISDSLDHALRDDREVPMTLGSPLNRHCLVLDPITGTRHHIWSLYTCFCQVYPLYSHLIFYPSFLTSSLPRKALERHPAEDCRQNQTTVARTRQPPFKRPSSESYKRFNQSINQIKPEL